MQSRAKHAAPGDPSRTRAVLPGVLLAAAGTAFAGLAIMPAAAADTTVRVTAAQTLAPVELAPVGSAPDAPAPVTANLALMSALEQGSVVANTPPPPPPPPPVVEPPTEDVTGERASRDRATEEEPDTEDADDSADSSGSDGAEYARPGTGRITSGYGRRWGRLHAGVDIAAGTGARISAAASGTVISSGTESGYGKCVRIRHADGTVSLYGHMSALMVSKGDKVSAGEQVGREGNTGQSTGPHLHFEVRIDDTPVNPVPWLSKRGVNL